MDFPAWAREIVSRETLDRLEEFEILVAKWTKKINLISSNDVSRIRIRHTLDCLQIFEAYKPKSGDVWLDLGSGGGYPGLVAAIVTKEIAPDLEVMCVEADRRKSAFLRTAIHDLGINARVIADRIQNIEPAQTTVISSRALAPLETLLNWSSHVSQPNTRFLFLKGVSWKEEIELARKNWQFSFEAHPSRTQDGAALLEITNVKPR